MARIHKKVSAQVSRHVQESFQRLRDAGMPARGVAAAFGPAVLSIVVNNGGPANGKVFLKLITDTIAAEARQAEQQSHTVSPAPQPTPLFAGTLDDLRNLGNYAKESIYRVLDLGFDPHVVLLSFGLSATEMVIESEGYNAALAWLEELSGMIDLYPR